MDMLENAKKFSELFSIVFKDGLKKAKEALKSSTCVNQLWIIHYLIKNLKVECQTLNQIFLYLTIMRSI